MSVIQLVCKHCGLDRFRSSTSSSKDEAVTCIQCVNCSALIDVDDVVWFKDDYIATGALSMEENTVFVNSIYLIPGV